MTVFEMLIERLPEIAKEMEVQLQQIYAIDQFRISIRGGADGFRYSLDCHDAVHGFSEGHGKTMTEAMGRLTKRLTPRGEQKTLDGDSPTPNLLTP